MDWFNFVLILITVLLAYGVFKLHRLYKKHDDLRYVVLLAILLLVFTDTWVSFYGQNLKIFLERYRFALTLLPVGVYFFYSYLDKKRHREEREKEHIKKAFQQYVMPAIIDQMLKEPDKLKLGGEKRNLSILFSDIRGFTGISEQLGPEDLVNLLNDYLNEMTEVVLENRGVVDKYIGDAIMAFWNAPVDDPTHVQMSVKTAVEMMKRLQKKQKEWTEKGYPMINIGIGINCGDVIVGNMGSHKRFDYTCLGDHVNLASRVEGINKLYGTNIIVTENCLSLIKNFELRELDLVAVKGKKKPVKIYEVIWWKKDQKTKKWLHEYKLGLRAYKERKWDLAKKHFAKADKEKTDLTCKLYIDRCEEFAKKEPPKNWDGVYKLKTK